MHTVGIQNSLDASLWHCDRGIPSGMHMDFVLCIENVHPQYLVYRAIGGVNFAAWGLGIEGETTH